MTVAPGMSARRPAQTGISPPNCRSDSRRSGIGRPRWGVILRYIVNGWSPLGSRFYLLLIALGIWFFTSPALERTASLQFDWIFQIWIRNVILITVVAGGLHLYLYTFRGQGDEWRYDKRAYPAKGKAFLFGNQLWDNVFWTLGSGVAVQTAYEVFFMWAYANGIATLITLEENPVLFIVLILLIPYWNAVHFDVQHRLLHWPPLFRWVHFRHHRNVNLGPWSGLTQHPVEHVVDQSDCMIFLFIPSHPVHVIFQLMYHGVNGPVTHTGYDGHTPVEDAALRDRGFFPSSPPPLLRLQLRRVRHAVGSSVRELPRWHRGRGSPDSSETRGDEGEAPAGRGYRGLKHCASPRLARKGESRKPPQQIQFGDHRQHLECTTAVGAHADIDVIDPSQPMHPTHRGS